MMGGVLNSASTARRWRIRLKQSLRSPRSTLALEGNRAALLPCAPTVSGERAHMRAYVARQDRVWGPGGEEGRLRGPSLPHPLRGTARLLPCLSHGSGDTRSLPPPRQVGPCQGRGAPWAPARTRTLSPRPVAENVLASPSLALGDGDSVPHGAAAWLAAGAPVEGRFL